MTRFRDRGELAAETRRVHEWRIRVQDRWFDAPGASIENPDHVAQFLTRRFEAGLRPATLRGDLYSLARRAEEEWCWPKERVRAWLAPAKEVVAGALRYAGDPGTSRAPCLGEGDILKLVAGEADPELEAAFAFAFLTGSRPSELFRLRPEEVRFVNGFIEVQYWDSKSAKGRTVRWEHPIDTELRSHLAEIFQGHLRLASAGGPLFPNLTRFNGPSVAYPASRERFLRALRAAARRVDVGDVSGYTPRRSAATLLYAETGSISAVQGLLRHKRLSDTLLYLDHPDEILHEHASDPEARAVTLPFPADPSLVALLRERRVRSSTKRSYDNFVERFVDYATRNGFDAYCLEEDDLAFVITAYFVEELTDSMAPQSLRTVLAGLRYEFGQDVVYPAESIVRNAIGRTRTGAAPRRFIESEQFRMILDATNPDAAPWFGAILAASLADLTRPNSPFDLLGRYRVGDIEVAETAVTLRQPDSRPRSPDLPAEDPVVQRHDPADVLDPGAAAQAMKTIADSPKRVIRSPKLIAGDKAKFGAIPTRASILAPDANHLYAAYNELSTIAAALIMFSGMVRPAELLRMRWEHLQLEGADITCRDRDVRYSGDIILLKRDDWRDPVQALQRLSQLVRWNGSGAFGKAGPIIVASQALIHPQPPSEALSIGALHARLKQRQARSREAAAPPLTPLTLRLSGRSADLTEHADELRAARIAGARNADLIPTWFG